MSVFTIRSGNHVLLTGPPGIGKTTLVRKTVEELYKEKRDVSGFYTEEIRVLRKRAGFQVVTLDGRRGTLASLESKSVLKVGNYGVELAEFETIAIPTITKSFSLEATNGVLVIDEIGKMELFSSQFKSAVDKAFDHPNLTILATIPVPKGKPIAFVEKIRNTPNAILFTIDINNRDHVMPDIIKALGLST